MNIVIFGLTISSAWGNGHATLWRALCRALGRRGHHVTFFEQDLPYYAQHRDLPQPAGYALNLYDRWESVRGDAMQAREHRVNGALVLRPRSMKAAGTGRLFIERALEAAGIPVLPIEADVVDAREWDADEARAGVRSFLDRRVLQ